MQSFYITGTITTKYRVEIDANDIDEACDAAYERIQDFNPTLESPVVEIDYVECHGQAEIPEWMQDHDA